MMEEMQAALTISSAHEKIPLHIFLVNSVNINSMS